MPGSLSKYFIDASCQEYAHPWTTACGKTMVGLGLHTLQESLRLYTTVYLVTFLMRGEKLSKANARKIILGIAQSTAFLAWSGFSYSMFICALRHVLGHFNVLTVSFLPSFLSSFTAIFIERPSRRTLLSLYVSNIATETLFKMGVWRGYFSPIPYGEVYIFAVSIAVLLYFFRSKTDKNEVIYTIFRYILGRHEETKAKKEDTSTDPKRIEAIKTQTTSGIRKSQRRTFNILWKSLQVYQEIIRYIKNLGKNSSCPHPHSCAHDILMGGLKSFNYGVCAQVILKMVLQMKRIFAKPKQIGSIIFKKENLNMAIFLGGFTALYKLVSCSLRRILNKDSNVYAIPAGLLASIAFAAYPDSTIALHFMWKALQILWNNAEKDRKVPKVRWFVIFLYCFSTALLFHTAILEPQNLRPSYWKFLYNISGGRIASMNREPLDNFGLGTSESLREVLRKTHTSARSTYSF